MDRQPHARMAHVNDLVEPKLWTIVRSNRIFLGVACEDMMRADEQRSFQP